MPYTDPLDPATPISTEAAGQGDDRIRELKRALIERLETAFTDLDADPLKLIDGSIDPTTMFADGSISGAKLTNGTVTLAKLAGLPGIADGSVTNPKIADGAVTETKIADDAVTAAKIPDGTLRRAKLHANLRQDLVYWKQMTLTLGSAVIAANGVYATAVILDTNDQYGVSVAVVVQPAFIYNDGSVGSVPTNPIDYFIIHAATVQSAGNEYVVLRLKNLSTLPQDISGITFYIHLLQRLSTAPAEAP